MLTTTKKILIVALLATMIVSLAGCGGVSQEDYDKAVADYEAAQETIAALTEQNESLQTELNDANTAYSKLQAEKDILQAKYDTVNATPTENNVVKPGAKTTKTPESVSHNDDAHWNTPLPNGLTAKIQCFDDDCTMLIHYKNETGEDISLTTYYIFGDDRGNAFMQGSASMMFFADGTEHIEVIEAWDEIGMFGLDYDIESPYKKIREANESLSVNHWKNGNGSVSATFSAPDGASVSGNLFFLDENGAVLGYQYFGIGFADSMDYDFDAPDFEYSNYLLCYEAMA